MAVVALTATEIESRLKDRPYPATCTICDGTGIYINSRGRISDQPCDIFTGGCQNDNNEQEREQ